MTVVLSVFAVLVVLNLFLGDGRNVGFSLVTYAKKVTWSTANSQTGTGEETSWATAPGVTNSSRTDLHYGSDFNRDDLTLTEGECDAFFPKLWKDLNRVKAYYPRSNHSIKSYLERSCADETTSQLRVVMCHNLPVPTPALPSLAELCRLPLA